MILASEATRLADNKFEYDNLRNMVDEEIRLAATKGRRNIAIYIAYGEDTRKALQSTLNGCGYDVRWDERSSELHIKWL